MLTSLTEVARHGAPHLPMDEKAWICKDFSMPMLPDGTYDVVVVDAEGDDEGIVHIELAVTLGRHLGRVVKLRSTPEAAGAGRDADVVVSSMLGVAGTLRVRNGLVSFRPETA